MNPDLLEIKSSNSDILGVMLAKRLGRMEVTSKGVVDKWADIEGRCEVVEEALLEEHAAREEDQKRITKLEDMVAHLETVTRKLMEGESEEKLALKRRIGQLEVNWRQVATTFVELVESCEEMEGKIKDLEYLNARLEKELKALKLEEKQASTNKEFNPDELVFRPRSSSIVSPYKPLNTSSSPYTNTIFSTSPKTVPAPPPVLTRPPPPPQPCPGQVTGKRIFTTPVIQISPSKMCVPTRYSQLQFPQHHHQYQAQKYPDYYQCPPPPPLLRI